MLLCCAAVTRPSLGFDCHLIIHGQEGAAAEGGAGLNRVNAASETQAAGLAIRCKCSTAAPGCA